MKILECTKEAQVVDALKCGRWDGPWSEDLRKHASSCAVCSEVVAVAGALRLEENLAAKAIRLPSAGLVWWKAQRAAHRAAEERAAQPIALVERLAQVFGALMLLGIGIWQWPRILGWFDGSKGVSRAPGNTLETSGWAHRFFESFVRGFGHSSNYLLLGSVGAFLMVMALAAYVVWHEE